MVADHQEQLIDLLEYSLQKMLMIMKLEKAHFGLAC